MTRLIECSDVGVAFTVPRHTPYGLKPRLVMSRRMRMWGLQDISLNVEAGQIVGLIGSNGAGKTTLLRTIASIYRPDIGSISLGGRVGPLLSLDGGLKQELSGRENAELSAVLLGASNSKAGALAERAAEFAGLQDFFDAEVRTYSSGMKARLAFGVVVSMEPSILLLDEAISFSDSGFSARAEAFLQESARAGGCVVLASHDTHFLRRLCDVMVHLEKGRIVAAGDPDVVLDDYGAEPRDPQRRGG